MEQLPSLLPKSSFCTILENGASLLLFRLPEYIVENKVTTAQEGGKEGQ